MEGGRSTLTLDLPDEDELDLVIGEMPISCEDDEPARVIIIDL